MKCNYRNNECGRMSKECAYCYVTYENLCDSCEKEYPSCEVKNIKFGCDIDTEPRTRQKKDNIFYCDSYERKQPKQTNADRIRNMTNKELAEFLESVESAGYNDSSITPKDDNNFPIDMLEWLEREVLLR